MKGLGIKLLIVLGLFGLIGFSLRPKKVLETKPETMVSVTRTSGEVEEIPLEEYIIGVVSGEMPVSFHPEALKAQAVASRTFVLSRNLKVDDSTSSQVYLDQDQRRANWQDDYPTNEQLVEAAVKATAGEVLTYQGDYISALFFSSCNGKTEDNDAYFTSAGISYLQSVDSKWDLANDKTYREKTFDKASLNEMFQTENFNLEITGYTDSGHVASCEVSGTTYSGREIREKLGLASTDFKVSEKNDQVTFTTVGFGHGVGMSQYGANGMGQEGYSYQEILSHYYQGTKLEKI